MALVDLGVGERSVRCADILGARDIRVFSLLAHDGFALSELDGDYDKLIRLAERQDCRLHIENDSEEDVPYALTLAVTILLPSERSPVSSST